MEEARKKTDRRILKTKKAIRNAFAELIAEKDVNEISVKEIADTADIDRKTFYNYYNGVYQLIDEIENEVISALNAVMGEIDLKRDLTNPYQIFVKLTAVINNDLDFYSHMMKADRNSSLVLKITDALDELSKKMKAAIMSQAAVNSKTVDIMTDYIFAGMLAVYRTWFNSSRELSIEEMSKTVGILTSSGVNGLLTD